MVTAFVIVMIALPFIAMAAASRLATRRHQPGREVVPARLLASRVRDLHESAIGGGAVDGDDATLAERWSTLWASFGGGLPRSCRHLRKSVASAIDDLVTAELEEWSRRDPAYLGHRPTAPTAGPVFYLEHVAVGLEELGQGKRTALMPYEAFTSGLNLVADAPDAA